MCPIKCARARLCVCSTHYRSIFNLLSYCIIIDVYTIWRHCSAFLQYQKNKREIKKERKGNCWCGRVIKLPQFQPIGLLLKVFLLFFPPQNKWLHDYVGRNCFFPEEKSKWNPFLGNISFNNFIGKFFARMKKLRTLQILKVFFLSLLYPSRY